MQKMNKSLGFPIAASSQNQSFNQSQQDLSKRVNTQLYHNNNNAGSSSSKNPHQRQSKGASLQKRGLKNYSLNQKLEQGFDSDGDRADVEEIDDTPSHPLETSIRQYQTPSKRGPTEVSGVKVQGSSNPNGQNISKLSTHKRHDSIGRHPPNQGQGQESISDVTRFMDDFYAKRGYFGPGGQNLKKKSTSTKGDDYFNSLESLVDKYLTQVAQKIAEKRQLEVQNSQLRTNINRVNTDIGQGDRAQQKLENDKQKTLNQNSNLNIQVSSLKQQLNQVHNKIDQTKSSYKQQLSDLNQHFERMRDTVEDEGCMVANTKNQIQMKKQAMSTQIKDLQKKYLDADKAAALLSQKHSYSKHLEDSRISKLKDKAKILSSLMSHQDISHSTSALDPNKGNILAKNITKILVSATQSPQRGQAIRASQSASMSIARASVNAQRKSYDSNPSKFHSSVNRSGLKY